MLQATTQLCRAKDSSAQLASAWRLVQVQQLYAVTLTLPLSLSASDSADAQTQADALMTGSNATAALATGLSAGLIAGESALRFLPGPTFLFVVSACKCRSSGGSMLLQLHLHMALCFWKRYLEKTYLKKSFDETSAARVLTWSSTSIHRRLAALPFSCCICC